MWCEQERHLVVNASPLKVALDFWDQKMFKNGTFWQLFYQKIQNKLKCNIFGVNSKCKLTCHKVSLAEYPPPRKLKLFQMESVSLCIMS